MGKYAYMEIHIEKVLQLPAVWTLIASVWPELMWANVSLWAYEAHRFDENSCSLRYYKHLHIRLFANLGK